MGIEFRLIFYGCFRDKIELSRESGQLVTCSLFVEIV